MENVFLNYYKNVKENLNKYINDFNSELKQEENNLLKENIDVFANLNSDGKLIRGTLVNLGYKLKNEDTTYSYPLSLAFEIFQTAILVHDDIIDNDDVRRKRMAEAWR
jgi:geranylgeranyl diphosphate synthase type I